jgi:Fe-S metabolism associated domain
MRRSFTCISWAAAVVLLSQSPTLDAFVPHRTQHPSLPSHSLASTSLADSSKPQELDLGLTPELKRVTEAFAAIGDEQVRYKQLLYMAQNTKEANSFPEASKIPENKVPGCLSTVYVDGKAEYSDDVGDYVINFIGDSDGLLTKGLVALLVR